MESKDTNLNGNPYLGIFPSFPPLHPQQMRNLPWVDMDVKEGHLDHKYGPPHSYQSQISHPLQDGADPSHTHPSSSSDSKWFVLTGEQKHEFKSKAPPLLSLIDKMDDVSHDVRERIWAKIFTAGKPEDRLKRASLDDSYPPPPAKK